MNNILSVLNNEIVLLDGAMGTMLLASGIDTGMCPEILNITHPSLITDIHKSYVDSGAQIIYTNTFGANSEKIPPEYDLKSIIGAAVNNAKKAAAGKAFVAYDMGPSGKLLEPSGDFSFDKAYELFKSQVIYACEFGVDLFVCETFTDLYEMKAALLAVKENSTLPVICTMSFEEDMRTFQGTEISSMALTLEGLGANAIGINCSLNPYKIAPVAEELLKWTNLPIVIKANAGIPRPDGSSYNADTNEFTYTYRKLASLGVSIFGGCCGTTPEYISDLKKTFADIKVAKRNTVKVSAVCSSIKTVTIDGVKVIGERLNPTGKKLYREALIKGDLDYILSQAISQIEAGADILDVNTGMPEIDETETMCKTIIALQKATGTPLQIDSGSACTIEKALRYYNGKPLVNSVNGDDETLDSILPLVKKYGACIIGLTLDKTGLPKTVEKRMEIADKILTAAQKHGIDKSNVIIDPLTLTVSTEQEQVENTLEALRLLKKKGIKTLLGVSNISFGLPQREYINLSFLIMALNCGLNMPIINPNSALMMNAINSYKVLSGEDFSAKNYVKLYADNKEKTIENNGVSLFDIEYCIVKGLKKEGIAACKKLLEKNDAMMTIKNYIIPALDKVGDMFEKGVVFLPQLIQSAETVKAAFDEIKKTIPNGFKNGNKIIMATVKGDIHDIGKNIVKTVLENYGYEIIDLGKNVEPSLICEEVNKNDCKLVGLSALMTTTVSSMENTILLLKQLCPKAKIMVGGAVLTEEYALKIGADFYAKDANAASKIAKTVFGK